MSNKTELPNNSTQWRNACKVASDFANRCGAGQLSFAESFLTQNGWEHFGIEHVSIPEAKRELTYLNTGETYQTTIGHENGKCFVTSWGGWHEEVEQQHCKENNVVRCGHCSEFIPVSGSGWDQTICEHCGNNVSG